MQDTHSHRKPLSMTDFGKNLAGLRKLRQLTQIELADLMDIQPRMVGRWEQGIAKPQFDYIIGLSKILEVTIDQLLLGEGEPVSDSFEIKNKKLKELCKQVDQLSHDDQELICHFLNMAITQDQLKQLVGSPPS